MRSIICMIAFSFLLVQILFAQDGQIKGKVTNEKNGLPLGGANVSVVGTGMGSITDRSGMYLITDVPEGSHEVNVRFIGYKEMTANVEVTSGGTATLNFSLEETVLTMGEIVVYGASRRPEKITEAPAAVGVLTTTTLQREGISNQAQTLVSNLPGVDVATGNMFDVNVNTRGFNSSLNRRVLILLDGRGMSIPFLGATRWDAFSVPIEDLGSIEFARGPGSALFGANAYSGVINITSPTPASIAGTKVSLSGGERKFFRGDVRHAGASGDWGYKFNVGRAQTESFAEDRRTSVEYEGIPMEPAPLDDGDISSLYGSARVDRGLGNNRFLSFEGGATQTENEVFVTGIGRVQVLKDTAPWGRFNFTSDRLFAQVFVNGRSTDDQIALASGATLKEHSSTIQAEFQHNTTFEVGDKELQLVWGGSHRIQNVDTKETLTPEKVDENYSGIYGQLQLGISDKVKLIGATRIDRSSLYDTEYSPKAGIVFSPREGHSLRFTYNHAFQGGNYSEYFLRVPAGAPVNLSAVGLGVVPIFARGNNNLEVETVDGFEIGYKGTIAERLFLTIDVYKNNLENFITDLLPGVNPDFAYTKTPQEEAVLNAVAQQVPALRPLLPGFTRIDGQPFFIFSYTNAGKVDEQGLELGINYYINDEWVVDANATFFDFEVKEQQLGDVLLPNTPKNKFNLGITYDGPKFYASLKWKHVPTYDWAAGVFVGEIKEYDVVNATLSYQINNNVRVGLNALNLTDDQHYEVLAGALLKRRVLGNVQFTF